MAPKKKEVQKFSLGEFIQDTSYGGSWADEVEDTYASGTQPLPASDRRPGYSSYSTGGYASLRDNLPQKLPDKPPYTAHLGNLSYDATVESVTDFFADCNPVSVRIIEDREQGRPKGFAYAEFGDLEGLKKALTFDGQSFEGRSIRIKVADPPKERMGMGADRGDADPRDFNDWTRKGPLADLPRGNDRRGSGSDSFERRAPREPMADDGKVRDYNNWERRGPLSPLAQAERPRGSGGSGSREGSRARNMETRADSYANRRASPAWGPGEGRQEGSRPPRREFSDRPERAERAPTAAEKDNQWRTSMRPDLPVKSPGQSREGSEAPSSPAATHALPVGRPKLNLTKRTVSDAPDITSPALSATHSKASPFGAARPIDTAAREREIEEKRVAAIKQKKEADEKAKEERRLAKEAAAKEAAEKEAADKEAAEQAAEKAQGEEAAREEAAKEEGSVANGKPEAAQDKEEAGQEEPTQSAGGSQDGEQKAAARPREPRGEPRGDAAVGFKSRAVESGNWRQASAGEHRGGSRGGHIPSGPRRGGGGPPRGPRNDRSDTGRQSRVNGSGPAAAHQSQAESSESGAVTVDEDGWTIVPNKNRRGGGGGSGGGSVRGSIPS